MSTRSHTGTRKLIVSIVLVVAGFGMTGSMQRHIDGMYAETTVNEVLYFPNDHLLKHFTGGLSNVVADIMWYRTVQYMSKEFNSDEARFTWLEQMVRATNRLDPYYVDPYRYGGVFLASIGDANVARDILHEGLVNCPDSWVIPYELHALYLMNKRHEPNAKEMASYYAFMIGERHDGELKQAFFNLSRQLLMKDNMVDEAVRFFTQAVETAEDPLLRQQAENQLRIAIIEKNVAVLNKAAKGYEEEQGKALTSLDELITAGYINELPDDPQGGEYALNAEGEVINSELQQPILEYILNDIQDKIAVYREAHGTNPPDLETIWPNFYEEGPKHPFTGDDLSYDPVTGVVQ